MLATVYVSLERMAVGLYVRLALSYLRLLRGRCRVSLGETVTKRDLQGGGWVGGEHEGEPQAPLSLADKLDKLFETSHGRGGRQVSNDEVAAAINARGGTTISASYLWLLRTGKRDNPGKAHLEALARYFGVPPAYFFDDEIARQVDAQLTLLAAVRDAGVMHLALRAAALSPQALHTITAMVEHARHLEGVPDEDPAGATGGASESPGGPA